MDFPSHTAAYAGAFGITFAVLSAWVVIGRGQWGIHHGDGGDERLGRRIRAHGNFAEYVPLILGMTALLEASGTRPWAIHLLLGPLLIARLIHPIGMLAPTASLSQYVLRATSSTVTWLVLIGASIPLLVGAAAIF